MAILVALVYPQSAFPKSGIVARSISSLSGIHFAMDVFRVVSIMTLRRWVGVQSPRGELAGGGVAGALVEAGAAGEAVAVAAVEEGLTSRR
jgi:hypothetical protein